MVCNYHFLQHTQMQTHMVEHMRKNKTETIHKTEKKQQWEIFSANRPLTLQN